MHPQVAGVRPPGGEAAPVQEEAHAGAHDGGELILRDLQAVQAGEREIEMVDIGRLLGRLLATRRRWSNWSGSTSRKLCPSSPSTSLSCPTSSSTLMPGERDGGSGDGGGDGGDGGGLLVVEIRISIHLPILAP